MKHFTHSSHIEVLLFLREHHGLDSGPLNALFYALGILPFYAILGFLLFNLQDSA